MQRFGGLRKRVGKPSPCDQAATASVTDQIHPEAMAAPSTLCHIQTMKVRSPECCNYQQFRQMGFFVVR